LASDGCRDGGLRIGGRRAEGRSAEQGQLHADDAGFGLRKMDLTPPATAPEEIIKQFAAKESEFQQALNHYTYRRTAKVQTIDDDNKVDGEYYEVDDVIFDRPGRGWRRLCSRRRTR